MKAARSKEEYKKKCKMEGDNLIIKGKTYTIENLSSLPEEINGYNSTSKCDDNSLGFFGELNPMSNFHRYSFTVDNIKYHSAEQFIQREKAIYFKDNMTTQEILDAKTPIEYKELSQEIGSYDNQKRKEVAKEICFKGIDAKFQQNENLCNILLWTGNLTLVESSYNSFWGTGIPLHREDCLNSAAWTSIGLLRDILMTIRRELHDKNSMRGTNNCT